MTTKSRCAALAAALSLALLAGCTSGSDAEQPTVASTKPADVVFTDATAAAGIDFKHINGAAGQKWLPETLGSGVAFLDYDNDGYPDLFLVNGRAWKPAADAPTSKLYHNNHDGTFTDVTAQAGLAVMAYGMGVAFGDIDNDGFSDIYLTALEGDRLFHNNGNGSFEDISKAAGIANAGFGMSVAFLDYDRDGLLDVFVDNYVKWSPENDLWCTLDGDNKTYCTPESYTGQSSKLYRNVGDLKFEDVSDKAGVGDPTCKALGVAILDSNGDGWPDIFQANDTEPNKLYVNQQDGTFKDIGLTAGVAFAEDGRARGAMGVDAADYDRSGRPHLVVGNFSNEMVNLFHNEGTGLFVDDAPNSDVGRKSLLSLTFGMFFFDYDLDGYLDIFAANGHLDEEINNVQPKVTYAQPPQLYRNIGGGRFELADKRIGAELTRPIVARGAAYADYDRDGDLDVVVTTTDGPAHLFRNDGGNANSYIAIKLVGAKSNRGGFGAKVTVISPSGKQTQTVRSGSSYLSQSDSTLTFGLGDDLTIDEIDIEWPSGEQQRLEKIDGNQRIVVQEGQGILGTS